MSSSVAEITVRERITTGIAEGEFPPGTQLVESMLARRFGVSRSPIRGALGALEGDGLVIQETGGDREDYEGVSQQPRQF